MKSQNNYLLLVINVKKIPAVSRDCTIEIKFKKEIFCLI